LEHSQPHIQKLLEDRYYLRDEEGNLLENTPEEMFARVAMAVADAEKSSEDMEAWQTEFYYLMKDNKFLPNTPTLINAGKDTPGSFSACFVLPVEDSMEGIFDAVKKAAIIMKSGGGVGFNFGHLREEGAIVKSTGHKSSGPISFMRVFDSMCQTISQGGVRRGAMMGILPVWHPDIEKFIKMKDDGVSFSNFNISVGITDTFISCVEDDLMWELISPTTKEVVKKVPARDLWNKIVEHAHKTGDPGLFFLDTVNKAHPLDEEIESPNPCLHGSTLLVDENGLRRINEGDGEFYTAWKTGEKATVKVTLSSGQEIICTPDHLIMTTTGFIEAKDTLEMSIITDTPFRFHDDSEPEEEHILAGYLFGDGYICGNGSGYSVKLNPEKEPDVAALLEKYGFNRQDSGAYYKKLSETFGKEWYGTHCEYKVLPKEILANYTKLRGFLRGLFEANGSVHSERVTYKTTSKKLAQEIQIALNVMNIKSYITTNKAKETEFANGTYQCKQSYDLNIGDMYSIANFGLFVGFISEDKKAKLKAIDREPGTRRYPKVISVLPYKTVDVYDFSMNSDVTKWNNANGIGVHNCGEIPLRPYESCNLGSINLMAYLKEVRNIDTGTWGVIPYEFDWDALEKDIPTMVRFLDDVIDVNPFPLPEIDKASKESRKIGLGVMGWADCLIKMKIPYDSQEALDLAELLMRFIKEQAEEASQKLGEEKGLFPLDNSKITGMFRRNATLLCVAPTGTLSRIAGVSSGIEPVFAWNTHHKLVDLEYDEIHWAWKEIKDLEKSYSDETAKVSLPKYMKTANEITPNWHLRMQAAFQKYIDNSVSKTINLPSSATFDDIHEIYRRAWEMGLKGITVYRDGSKVNQPLTSLASDGVIKQAEIKSVVDSVNRIPINLMTEILSKTKTSTEIEKQPLRKRGPVTIGVTHKVDTGKGKIYITVNYNEYHSEPVEVFIRLGHMSTSTENALAEWSGRLLSIMFKYNIPTQCIIKQGNKVFSDSLFWYNKKSFQSLPQLISFLLSFTFEEALEMAEIDIDSMLDSRELLIEESGDIVDGEYCYNCGTYGIIGEGGCKVCHNCGYENCG